MARVNEERSVNLNLKDHVWLGDTMLNSTVSDYLLLKSDQIFLPVIHLFG